jgi:hypothetical protein
MSLPFEKSFASHPRASCWSDKNEKKPEDIKISSGKKFWFDCIDCSHKIEKELSSIVRGEWCPYCSKPCKKLCDNEECVFCFNNSFASHKKAKFWSDKNNISQRYITKSSSKKYIFNCNICNHNFKSTISDITSGYWCGYCANHIFCDNEECIFCFNNSFASHEKAPYWSDKNNKKPNKVALKSSKKYWFNCVDCGHSFESILSNISKGHWCPFCTNKSLCDNDKCSFCFNKSFASHKKSQFWSNKNNINPRNIIISYGKKYLFDCNICNNTFESEIRSIKSGCWCPICINKTEKKLYIWLSERYKTKHQCRYDWCKNPETNKYLPYDFEIESNIIIELDGKQHFKQVMNWKSPELQKERDLYKIQCAFDNHKHIIRIFQEDVWNDKNEWDIKLIQAINTLKNIINPSLLLIGIKDDYYINDI